MGPAHGIRYPRCCYAVGNADGPSWGDAVRVSCCHALGGSDESSSPCCARSRYDARKPPVDKQR